MIARVRSENQPSSEREKVVVAATASSMAGSAAMIENNSTMRTCSRAPASLARQARHMPMPCHAMTAIMAAMSTTLKNSAVSTTSSRGAIGVRPVRMR